MTPEIIASGLTGDPDQIIGRWDMDTHFTGMRLTLMKDTLCRHYQFCNHSPTPRNSDMNFLSCSNGGQQIIFNELFIDPNSMEVDRNLKDYASVDVEKILTDLQSEFRCEFSFLFDFFLLRNKTEEDKRKTKSAPDRLVDNFSLLFITCTRVC